MKSTEYNIRLIYPLFLLGLGAFVVNGYVYSSGPLPRNPNKLAKKKGGNSACKPSDFYRFDQDCVDDAFRELRNELGDDRREAMDWMAAMVDPFEVDQFPVDKRTAKKWIEKAFDFAFEFNEDFATAQGEKDATEEFLRKSRDWVARLYEDDEGNEEHVDENGDDDLFYEEVESPKVEDSKIHNNDGRTSASIDKKSEVDHADSAPSPEKMDETMSETPNLEDQSTKDIFKISIDLPGVDKSDVDITLDGDLLFVRGRRDGGRDGLASRIYTKKLSVSEKEVDMERLEASLKNGVLVISAPKQKPTESRRKIKVS